MLYGCTPFLGDSDLRELVFDLYGLKILNIIGLIASEKDS
jgi:hypothetical protein